MSDRARPGAIAEMLYGPGYSDIWEGNPPTPSDVSAWLKEQRKLWAVRTLANGMTIHEVTAWCRQQGLKRLDWDFVPKKNIWFRDPQIAMIWDLTCSQNTTDSSVDQSNKT